MESLEKNEFGFYIKPAAVSIEGFEDVLTAMIQVYLTSIKEKYGPSEFLSMTGANYHDAILTFAVDTINTQLPEGLSRVDGNSIRGILFGCVKTIREQTIAEITPIEE